MTDVSETVANVKEIEKDLLRHLANAENNSANDNDKTVLINDGKSVIVVSKAFAKLFCDVKNAVMARILSKDYDEDIKAIIRDKLRTTDKEIELYKCILEELGNQYVPEEHKAMVSKILGSPLILAFETEYEKIGDMLQEVKNALKHKIDLAPKSEGN